MKITNNLMPLFTRAFCSEPDNFSGRCSKSVGGYLSLLKTLLKFSFQAVPQIADQRLPKEDGHTESISWRFIHGFAFMLISVQVQIWFSSGIPSWFSEQRCTTWNGLKQRSVWPTQKVLMKAKIKAIERTTWSLKLFVEIFLVITGLLVEGTLISVIFAITTAHNILGNSSTGCWADTFCSLAICWAHTCTSIAAGHGWTRISGTYKEDKVMIYYSNQLVQV